MCIYIYIYIYLFHYPGGRRAAPQAADGPALGVLEALDLGGFKGSATKGQFRKCGLTVVSNYDPNRNKASVCNEALESQK